LPGSPLVKALGLYFVKRGFLDGYPGFAYSILMGFYEYLIVLKGREFRADAASEIASSAAGIPQTSVVSGIASRQKAGLA
jgi:hypothetical protein